MSSFSNHVIVSRHAGAIEWILEDMFPASSGYRAETSESRTHARVFDRNFPSQDIGYIPIISGDAKLNDVKDRVVIGNVPMSLAVLALRVYAIEFAGAPPRGQEYSAEQMRDAGARLVPYIVIRGLDRRPEEIEELKNRLIG